MGGNDFSWKELLQAFIEHPDKGALLLVLIVGAWRWIKELFHEAKETNQHESFTDMLLRENKELREELRKRLAEEDGDNSRD